MRLRLSANRWCRFSQDWGGGTLRLETQPPNVQRDYKDLHGSEKRRADAATAALATAAARCDAAVVHAAKLQRRIDSTAIVPSELTPPELSALLPTALGTCDGGPGCVNLRKRRHAERAAADAAASEAAAVQVAGAARAESKAARAEAKAATAMVAKLEGAVEARRDAETAAREYKRAVRAAEAAQAAAEKTAEEAEAAQTEAEAAQAEAEAAQAEAEAAQAAAETRLMKCQERLSTLKEALGIESERNVPSASNHGRGVPFIRAAVTDRPAADVATALKLAGGTAFLRELLDTKEFAPLKKETIEATATKIQERWSPRLAARRAADVRPAAEPSAVRGAAALPVVPVRRGR